MLDEVADIQSNSDSTRASCFRDRDIQNRLFSVTEDELETNETASSELSSWSTHSISQPINSRMPADDSPSKSKTLRRRNCVKTVKFRHYVDITKYMERYRLQYTYSKFPLRSFDSPETISDRNMIDVSGLRDPVVVKHRPESRVGEKTFPVAEATIHDGQKKTKTSDLTDWCVRSKNTQQMKDNRVKVLRPTERQTVQNAVHIRTIQERISPSKPNPETNGVNSELRQAWPRRLPAVQKRKTIDVIRQQASNQVWFDQAGSAYVRIGAI